jgi:hypothetical protein
MPRNIRKGRQMQIKKLHACRGTSRSWISVIAIVPRREPDPVPIDPEGPNLARPQQSAIPGKAGQAKETFTRTREVYPNRSERSMQHGLLSSWRRDVLRFVLREVAEHGFSVFKAL